MAAQSQGAYAPAVPSLFTFAETRNVRVHIDNGEPWFCANDICDVLEYGNPHDAISRHIDEDDLGKREVIDAIGRSQQTNFISEAGVYALILGSEKAEAKVFKRWLTHEVLPQIRKVGFYGTLDLKERISLGNQMLGIIDRLGKSGSDAFVRRALLGRLQEVCLLLGQPVPDAALLGKDAAQIPLAGV